MGDFGNRRNIVHTPAVFRNDVRTTAYAGFQLALVGVAGHSVADIHCR